MKYDLETEAPGTFRVWSSGTKSEVNRFGQDWITLHMLPTIYYLAERHQSAYAFLKKSGMKWEEKVRALTPATLANAAKLHADGHADLPEKHVFIIGLREKFVEKGVDRVLILRSPCVKAEDGRLLHVVTRRFPTMAEDEWK